MKGMTQIAPPITIRSAVKDEQYRQLEALADAKMCIRDRLGDKLLTDMLAAHRAGVTALMVEPLGGPVGVWNHVLHLLQRPFKAACPCTSPKKSGTNTK